MRWKWLIGTVLFIVVLEAWTITLAMAQYQCTSINGCGTSNNVTQCWGSCYGAGYTNCTTLVVKSYLNTPTNGVEKPGPCKNANGSWVDCYTQYNCATVKNDGTTCQWDYNDYYCRTTGAKPSDSCTSCSPPAEGTTQQFYTITCSNCGGG